MDETLRTLLASLALSSLVALAPQQGMIPVVNSKPTAAPLNPCLISAWPMNEGSGAVFHDVVGTNDATMNNGANITWQHTVAGSGFYTSLPGFTPKWNGSGVANATSTTINNFNGSTPFSVSMWMSYPGTSADQEILGNLNLGAGGIPGWYFYKHWTGVANIGRLDLVIISNNPSNVINVVQSANLSDTDIHYVVATYDGSKTAAGVVIYVDGASVATTVSSNTLTGSSASPIPTSIGALSGVVAPVVNPGVTADAEIYNCVLTPTQIATYYASGPGIY